MCNATVREKRVSDKLFSTRDGGQRLGVRE